ncbi:TfoX/Sxy family protein [Kiloniella laminariae]|uniref:TfoX/Sxy family protein n=1 Tax=Kiloniella laminariae TaxID=454162 RepID=A0ABT4LI45_9PROT|nr:TfoX/Sxy family protein [Kiloniella laminariae]MCZ4280775.1 TfoX/Sxy family protein [Kiloniella laminariae]
MKKALPSIVESTINRCLPLGDVRARAMFGGYGLYIEDVMFGLEADNLLYLKADKETEQHFIDAHCTPFTYQGKTAPVKMSYWTVPSVAADNQKEYLIWIERAVAAGKRARQKRPKKTKG